MTFNVAAQKMILDTVQHGMCLRNTFLTDGKQLLVETLFDRLLQFFNKKAELMFLSKLQYIQFSRFV